MTKFIRLGCMVFMALLGGFIGFDPDTPNQTSNATTMIRWVDVPKADVPTKELVVNLSSDDVSFRGDVDNTEVTVNYKPDQPKVVTEVKEIKVPVEVPVYTNDLVWSTKLLSKLSLIHI